MTSGSEPIAYRDKKYQLFSIRLEKEDITAIPKLLANFKKEIITEFRWANNGDTGTSRLSKLEFPIKKLKDNDEQRTKNKGWSTLPTKWQCR